VCSSGLGPDSPATTRSAPHRINTPRQGLRHTGRHGSDAAGDRREAPPAPRTVALGLALPDRIRLPPARGGPPGSAQGLRSPGPDGGAALLAPAPSVIPPAINKTIPVPAAPERAAGCPRAAGRAPAPACTLVPLPGPRSFC